MPRETIVVPDVGLNQIWTVRTWQSHSPRSLLTSGGMGTMGFSVPAAIGAKVGAPDRDVVVICGDGGFYMNIQELATISTYRLPIKIVVINNGHLGMIRQMQDLFYDARFTTSDLGDTGRSDRRWPRGSASRRSGSPWTRTRRRRSPG